MNRTRRLVAVPLVIIGLAAAACADGNSALDAGNETPLPLAAEPKAPTEVAGNSTAPSTQTVDGALAVGTTDSQRELPSCPTDALTSADGLVNVVFWHSMTAELEEALVAATNRYHSTQALVRVDLRNQGGYTGTIDKYVTASDARRPDLVQMPEYFVQPMAESNSVVPVESCLEASGSDTSDFLPRALGSYQYQGVQWAMPFNVSSPVLYFNKKMFVEAGLDPDRPPVTLVELRAAAQQLVGSGVASEGLVVDTGPDSGGGWFVEQWFGRAGADYSNNDNGRTAPSTEVLYDNATGVELMTYLQDLVADGLAFNVGDNAGGSSVFLKMADPTDPGAMTIATSAALGTVLSSLGSGLIPGLTEDDIGVGPMPGPGDGPAAQIGGGALWIVDTGDDATTAAVWDYVTFLTSVKNQSVWAAATGYAPIRSDAIDVEPLASTYASDPRFTVVYDQALASVADASATAPLLGPHRELRVIAARALAEIFDGADVQETLTAAVAEANAQIEIYNSLN